MVWGIIPARAGFTTPSSRPTGRTRDHPRSRGVYWLSLFLCGAALGSSPLARGLPRAARAPMLRDRIIPARAGFTTPCPGPAPPSRDHPRSRGVYADRSAWAPRRVGSSPLARGLPGVRIPRRARDRIIPARAGFTRRSSIVSMRTPDHPRSRGVYTDSRTSAVSGPGSSPLARGLRPRPHGGRRERRIIPARAGFTYPCSPDGRTGGDHPRSRGVYSAASGRRSRAPGSSPLARGLPSSSFTTVSTGGIIPARAGFTRPEVLLGPVPADHPRSRGVYPGRRRLTAHSQGSSPLARGLHAMSSRRTVTRGIIPARAGFTGGPARGRGYRGDHPRSRGVYHARGATHAHAHGSSPLARGLRILQNRGGGAPGIIPARAGFTHEEPGGVGVGADHPRSRGVYVGDADAHGRADGSSPLARGLPPGWKGALMGVGIIPARAGFTRWLR